MRRPGRRPTGGQARWASRRRAPGPGCVSPAQSCRDAAAGSSTRVRNCRVRSCVGAPMTCAGRAVLDDHAAVHEDDAVRDLAGEAHLVRDHHHGHALLGQVAHDRQDVADQLGVERRGGLVEEHHRGIHREGPGDRGALLLAARQLGRVGVGLVGEAHALEVRPRHPRRPRPCPVPSTRRWGRVTLSRTVRWPKRLNCWNTMPIRRRAASMSQSGSVSSMPPTVTVPAVGSSSRLMQRSRVDLPDPLGPMTQTTWPLRISRSIPRSTSRVAEALVQPGDGDLDRVVRAVRTARRGRHRDLAPLRSSHRAV